MAPDPGPQLPGQPVQVVGAGPAGGAAAAIGPGAVWPGSAPFCPQPARSQARAAVYAPEQVHELEDQALLHRLPTGAPAARQVPDGLQCAKAGEGFISGSEDVLEDPHALAGHVVLQGMKAGGAQLQLLLPPVQVAIDPAAALVQAAAANQQVVQLRACALQPGQGLAPGGAGARVGRERSRQWRVVGLLDDDAGKRGRELRGVTVLGPIGELPRWAARYDVRAPRDGLVEALPYKLGERPPAGVPLVLLLADGAPYARIYVPEPLRAQVTAGRAVDVTMDGVDGALRGVIRYVSAEAAYTPYYALTQKDRTRLSFLAEVALDELGLRPLAYVFPDGGYENVKDQFLMGDNLLVAPMVTKGTARTVQIPPGTWKADDGNLITGPIQKTFEVPLGRLLYFERQERP